VAPVAFELPLEALPKVEVFGPILHVCTYHGEDLPRVLQWLGESGYGLTLGIHSRIQSFVDQVVRTARVGNIYVNRSMIGAVVGVQPFGGEGLSGTGPKAGGPHYILRFATERTLTVNTAAVGGVTELLNPPARLTP
jgi:RHH-type proline utilization regulon transcriptional repressor/proline dehydrogenase/delta 1-pyrroline-5-carboxylate dehydrogenase